MIYVSWGQPNNNEPYIAPFGQSTPPEKEVFRISGAVVSTALVAIIFLAAGIFIGLIIAGFGTSSREIRGIVQEVVSEELNKRLTTLEITLATLAESGGGSGAGISAEELSALVQDAVANASRQQNYRAGDAPYLGVADAPVVIVEFSDFYCSFCGRHFQQTLTPLLETYDGYIRYAYRHFPSVGGDAAQLAGMASACANDQGKFWEYHNALFTNQDALRTATTDAPSLRAYLIQQATELELDVATFTSCYDTQQHLSVVITDAGEAQAIGARGTPAFLINGQFISGAQSYEYFANVIDAKLRELGIESPRRG